MTTTRICLRCGKKLPPPGSSFQTDPVRQRYCSWECLHGRAKSWERARALIEGVSHEPHHH